jgi:hypothetical protein
LRARCRSARFLASRRLRCHLTALWQQYRGGWLTVVDGGVKSGLNSRKILTLNARPHKATSYPIAIQEIARSGLAVRKRPHDLATVRPRLRASTKADRGSKKGTRGDSTHSSPHPLGAHAGPPPQVTIANRTLGCEHVVQPGLFLRRQFSGDRCEVEPNFL